MDRVKRAWAVAGALALAVSGAIPAGASEVPAVAPPESLESPTIIDIPLALSQDVTTVATEEAAVADLLAAAEEGAPEPADAVAPDSETAAPHGAPEPTDDSTPEGSPSEHADELAGHDVVVPEGSGPADQTDDAEPVTELGAGESTPDALGEELLAALAAVDVIDDVLDGAPRQEVRLDEVAELLELGTLDLEDRAVTDAVVVGDTFQTLGFTWPADTEHAPEFKVRVRGLDGEWSDWLKVEGDGREPDAGTPDYESAVRGGSDPWFVGEADAFQVATKDPAAELLVVDDITLSIIGGPPGSTNGVHDGVPDGRGADAPLQDEAGAGFASTRDEFGEPMPSDGSIAGSAPFGRSVGSAALAANVTVPPAVVSRAQWDAAPSRCPMTVAPTLRAAVVHHTAGTNNIPNAATARQHVRNIQAFHQNSRNWCDIGYNFLIDPFGNIIEGRANSLGEAVVGVHAGGFNTGTVGIAMLGDLTTIAAPNAAVEAFGRVIGWRLGTAGVNPLASQSWTVAAGDGGRFRPGQVVSLPNVMAHRDVSLTACPGDIGVTQLGAIRQAAQRNLGTAAPATITFNGRGWGHGRGMGQWGALGYAVDHGWSSQQILQHFYSGTTLATNAGNPDVSVELMAHTGRELRVRATALSVRNETLGANPVNLGKATVRLVRNGNNLEWFTGNSCNGTWTPRGTLSGTVSLTAGNTSDPAQMLRVCDPAFDSAGGGTVYRGRIDALVRSATQFAVNVLPVQDYLRGVVPREMPASWGTQGGGRGAQALQAQATAARSFALSGLGSPRLSTAVTCDTTACQVYEGMGSFNAAGQ